MKERHHRTDRKHPKTCTCTSCQARRLAANQPKKKKKRKPKSQRGKASKKDVAHAAMADALDFLGLGNSDGDKP
jgi:hypothetical protein